MEPVDFSILNEFKELMGEDGPQEVQELVNLYLEDAPVQLQSMRTSQAAGDLEVLKRAAHSFKSSCGNIGALGLQSLCLELEQKAASGDGGRDSEQLITRAEAAFFDVQAALNAYLAQ